jgi:hypothetical protein
MPPLTPFPRIRWSRLGIILASLLLVQAPALSAKPEVSREYRIKAVFLLNFTQFVEWPEEAFAGREEPFRIGILGEDPFGDFLERVLEGEKAGGRPLAVRRLRDAGEALECQMVFVSRSEEGRTQEILGVLKGRNILTVGDSPGFLRVGGVIRFERVGNRVHFRVNPQAAKDRGLSISAKMLRLATLVGPGED